MSPPATILGEESYIPYQTKAKNGILTDPYQNGHTFVNSIKNQYSDDDTLDLLCVGFGPASLAIAIALEDLEDKKISPKVLFLEKNSEFTWHPGMQIPGAKMQISFIKDLATLRNPRSKFTFINYLFTKQRLNQFINLSTHLPSRAEYEDYLRWCASHFEAKNQVQYDTEVKSVRAGSQNADGKVTSWIVTSLDSKGNTVTKRACNVVLAVGGKPMIPKELKGIKNVTHSSQFIPFIKNIKSHGSGRKFRFAVVGAGQSAAEIFDHLWSVFPESKISMIIKTASLRPSDDSPFVNEIFHADRVDDIFTMPSSQRAASLTFDRGTNYGVVRPALLEHLYDKLYMQRIATPLPSQWNACILSNRTIISANETQNRSSVILTLCDSRDNNIRECIEVDYIFAATGYLCNAHEDILANVRPLLQYAMAQENKSWFVQRDYRVMFDADKVSSESGIWLQGCNEKTHGLSDTLLSILAIRGGELINSIFGL
ncbi:L-ornithine N(5)-monooxygenase [Erysiphe necator]|nr:L-ornithine N(5)-monooxygenase [Erysiphe necator]